MKVLDLQCSNRHVFEGWFASEDDFANQLSRGLVSCPLCADVSMAMAQRVLASTDDVGEKFAEEARKIHYGETQERGIRGKATPEETESLLEEGIAVVALALPEALKGRLQ